jgi:hypothetical protein
LRGSKPHARRAASASSERRVDSVATADHFV